MNHYLQTQKEEIFNRINAGRIYIGQTIDKDSFDKGFEACSAVMQELLDKKEEEILHWFYQWKDKVHENVRNELSSTEIKK
jgi:hypothetical protein